jgi:sugar lactone lactonase YvrE
LRGILFIAALLLAALSLTTMVSAQEFTTVVAFDPAAAELPEAVALDGEGNAYVTLQTGAVAKVTPSGDVSTYAQLPDPGPEGNMTGLAFDRLGNLFVCLVSADPAVGGVWIVRPSGATSRFAQLGTGGLANWAVFDQNGLLYVSDSVLGRIWRITPDAEVSVWSEDPLLAGQVVPPLPFPVGTNGLAFDAAGQYLYSANTSFGRIDRFPIMPDGSAGLGETFVEDAALLGGVDDIAFDTEGHLYAANIAQDRIVVIAPDGTPTTLAEGPPLNNPSTVAFGVGPRAGQMLITNFSLLRALGLQPGTPEPALLSFDAGVAGILQAPIVPSESEPEPTATAAPSGLPSTGTGPDVGAAWWPLVVGAVLLVTAGSLAGAAWTKRR